MAHRILVIDDMRSIALAIARILEPRDCKIEFAIDGKTGLARLTDELFDLIILDVHLPDSNGISICSKIKRLPGYEHRPVLMLTSDTRNLDQGIMAGASDYILKPFNEVELIARVFTQLNISASRIAMNSELEKLRTELEVQEVELAETHADLQRYFYQTSHKLRSPINTIKGLLNLIRIDYPDTAANPYMSLLERAVDRIGYANDQVARIGSLKAHVQKGTAFRLCDMVTSILSGVQECDKIKCTIDIDPSLTLFTDAEVFRYGLEPVLSNAFFYCKLKQGNAPEIRIRLDNRQGTVLIIEDNGPGIKSSFIRNVFDMFFIGDIESAGNGLGLFICKLAFTQLNMPVQIQSVERTYTRVLIDITNGIQTHNNQHEIRHSA